MNKKTFAIVTAALVAVLAVSAEIVKARFLRPMIFSPSSREAERRTWSI